MKFGVKQSLKLFFQSLPALTISVLIFVRGQDERMNRITVDKHDKKVNVSLCSLVMLQLLLRSKGLI
jgi:hypothetical protein